MRNVRREAGRAKNFPRARLCCDPATYWTKSRAFPSGSTTRIPDYRRAILDLSRLQPSINIDGAQLLQVRTLEYNTRFANQVAGLQIRRDLDVLVVVDLEVGRGGLAGDVLDIQRFRKPEDTLVVRAGFVKVAGLECDVRDSDERTVSLAVAPSEGETL